MIHVSQLAVHKNGRRILDVAELVISTGEKLMITGPNGSGKTTFLKTLAHLESNYRGTITRECERRRITYVHQEPILFRGSVAHNLRCGLLNRKVTTASGQQLVRHWSKLLGIDHLLTHDSQRLSGGEKKRVALARALVMEPRLLLLDEPLAELDQESGDDLIAALQQLESVTIVGTTPSWDPRLESFRRLDIQDLARTARDKNPAS